ncbi:hypothetical protein C8R43DRAFT_1123897 [Mycena crocata]|nr:hypothetical protein C8R43DRAFT_1123897 [Mycena crocata]
MFNPAHPGDIGARYHKGRLSCASGYNDVPDVYTALNFDFHHLPRVSSRFVKLGDRLFELWSCNSTQLPYFPGVRSPSYLPVIPEDHAERRYDGHAGKHDCLYAPQYWRADTEHWPFLRHSSMISRTDSLYPAVEPIFRYWTADPRPGRMGTIDPSFVAKLVQVNRGLDMQIEAYRSFFRTGSRTWSERPAYATYARIMQLRDLRDWATAVDYTVAVQRGLREKDAWIRLIRERRRQESLRSSEIRRMRVPVASEELMGFWANGASEEMLLHSLAAGVPCFIVHEFPGGTGHGVAIPMRYSFLEGTELEAQFADCEYERLAVAEPMRLHAIFRQTDRRGIGPRALATLEARSSSAYQLALPRPDLLPFRPPAPPRRAPAPPPRSQTPLSEITPSRLFRPTAASGSSSIRKAPRAMSPDWGKDGSWGDSGASWCDVHPPQPPEPESAQPTVAPPAAATPTLPELQPDASESPLVGPLPNAGVDRYAAPVIDRLTIHPDHVPWCVPPPIPKNGKGKWDKYVLVERRSGMIWLRYGKGQEISSTGCYFDWLRRRELWMGNYEAPAGVVDQALFGAPAPRYPFFIRDGLRDLPQPASHWMYEQRESRGGEVGRVARLPSRYDLARVGVKKGNSSGAGASVRKGKGRAPPSDSESEYGGSDDDDEYEGEDVRMDVVEPRPAPTNVLVVNGLDANTSAVMFRVMAGDSFLAASTYPVAIFNGQGRMWLRFASVSAALRVMGTIRSSVGDLEVVHEPDALFVENAGYSRDHWTADSTAGTGIFEGPPDPQPAVADGTSATTTVDVEMSGPPEEEADEEMSIFAPSPRTSPCPSPTPTCPPPVSRPATPAPRSPTPAIEIPRPPAIAALPPLRSPPGLERSKTPSADLYVPPPARLLPPTSSAAVRNTVKDGSLTAPRAASTQAAGPMPLAHPLPARPYVPQPFAPSTEAESIARVPLSQRLTEPPSPAVCSLAQRLTTPPAAPATLPLPLASRLTDATPPLAARLSAMPLSQRLNGSPPSALAEGSSRHPRPNKRNRLKRKARESFPDTPPRMSTPPVASSSRLLATRTPLEDGEIVSKKRSGKARGGRSGEKERAYLAKKQARRELAIAREEEAARLIAIAEETSNSAALDLIPVMAAAAEAERLGDDVDDDDAEVEGRVDWGTDGE